LHNHADAEEVAQDTFVRAHRGLANFRGDSSLASWLYRIAINLARNRYWFYFRRRRHDTISIDQAAVEGSTLSLEGVLTDGAVAPRSESMTREFVALVAECMQKLDDSHREILTMRTKLDLSYEEIAVSLRINVGTVKSRVARARERLRQLLFQMAPEFGRESNVIEFFEFNQPRTAPGLVPA
jgi:RNA polymerase sigma-70 factor (ECF subfamily)